MVLLTVFFSHLQIIEEKGHTLPIWMRPTGAPPKNPRIHVELAEISGRRLERRRRRFCGSRCLRSRKECWGADKECGGGEGDDGGFEGLIECPVGMELPQVGEPAPGMFVFESGLRFSFWALEVPFLKARKRPLSLSHPRLWKKSCFSKSPTQLSCFVHSDFSAV